MAKLCPTLHLHAATRVGDYAELDLLQTLERGLSNAFTLFHSVDWSRGDGVHEQHGEIDVVVVNQAGDVLLMEVKAGKVDFLPGGIFKTYYSHTKDITAQVGLQYGERCLQRGFKLADIAVISMRGMERSVLQTLDKLGEWTLNRFTGKFDEGSVPIWQDGDLLLESVRRFKGQAAPAVVLTECDIAQLDPMNRRLLFVGLTCARMHLEWVISAASAKMLDQVINS